jgi:hypothetical protein
MAVVTYSFEERPLSQLLQWGVAENEVQTVSVAVSVNTQVDHALERGEGVLCLAPTWVPRA